MSRPTRSTAPPAPREFLSTGEVARLFGVSPSAVTRWARTGVLKAVRTPGGHYRFRASTLRRASIEIPDEPQRLD
jgi:excisionase family DNA binding protein